MVLQIGIFIAVICATLSWAVGDFLIQKSTRKVGDVESLAWIGIIGTFALLPFVMKDFDLLFSLSNLLLLLILGVITFIAALFDFEALRVAKLSTTDIIMELELPTTIVLGYLFFKETLSAWQLIITSLIFLGIVLIATESFAHWKVRWEKGVWLALLAAFGMGLTNFLTSASSRNISPIMAIWAPWLIFTIFCLVLIYKREGFSKFVSNASRFRWLLLGMGFFDTVAWLSYSFAVSRENIGLITAITESYPAFAIFLGVWLNKEKIKHHQYLGAALAIISSVVLALAH